MVSKAGSTRVNIDGLCLSYDDGEKSGHGVVNGAAPQTGIRMLLTLSVGDLCVRSFSRLLVARRLLVLL